MPVDLPGDAIVIRFAPTSPEKVLERAERGSRLYGRHLSSVFAARPRPGESDDDVIDRLLKASELANIDPASNRGYFVCSRADRLAASGFVFVKDGDEDEVAEHYSVDLGSAPAIEDAKRFLDAFDQRRKR